MGSRRLRFWNTYEPVNGFYGELIPALAEEGMRIEVILSASAYREGSTRRGSWQEHPRVAVRRVGRSEGARGAGLRYALGGLWTGTATGGNTVNVFLTQPPMFYAAGRLFRLLRGDPYVVIVMDLYPDAAFAAGVLDPVGPTAAALRFAQRRVLGGADGVVAIGRCMRDRILEAGGPGERIRVIPNWVVGEAGEVRSPRESRLRRSLEIGDDQMVVLYSGNIGRGHDLHDLLTAATRLETCERVRFVIIGGGYGRPAVEREIRESGLRNVDLLDTRPPAEVPDALAAGDVHFVSLRDGFEGTMVPSKAYSALASGRPILYQGHPSGEIARLIEEEEIGAAVRNGDVDGLEAEIRGFLDEDVRRDAGRRSAALARGRASSRSAVSAYVELFRRISGEGT